VRCAVSTVSGLVQPAGAKRQIHLAAPHISAKVPDRCFVKYHVAGAVGPPVRVFLIA